MAERGLREKASAINAALMHRIKTPGADGGSCWGIGRESSASFIFWLYLQVIFSIIMYVEMGDADGRRT